MINPIPCFSRRVSWKHRIHWRWLKCCFSVLEKHACHYNKCDVFNPHLVFTNMPSALVSPDLLHDMTIWNQIFPLVKFCGFRFVCASKPSQLIHPTTERQHIHPIQREWLRQLQLQEVKPKTMGRHAMQSTLSPACLKPQTHRKCMLAIHIRHCASLRQSLIGPLNIYMCFKNPQTQTQSLECRIKENY